MKIWNYVKKPGWILLIVCPLSTLCGQSISGIKPETDSLIRAEFLANAKRIHADLIRADFAEEKAAIAQDLFLACQAVLVVSQANEAQLKKDLAKAQQATAAQTDRRKMLQLEVWAWRILATITLIQILRK